MTGHNNGEYRRDCGRAPASKCAYKIGGSMHYPPQVAVGSINSEQVNNDLLLPPQVTLPWLQANNDCIVLYCIYLL